MLSDGKLGPMDAIYLYFAFVSFKALLRFNSLYAVGGVKTFNMKNLVWDVIDQQESDIHLLF